MIDFSKGRWTIREILELPEPHTRVDVRANYRRLAMQWHPDRNKDPKAPMMMKLINRAYAIAMGKEPPPREVPPPPPPGPTVRVYYTYTGYAGSTSGTNSTTY